MASDTAALIHQVEDHTEEFRRALITSAPSKPYRTVKQESYAPPTLPPVGTKHSFPSFGITLRIPIEGDAEMIRTNGRRKGRSHRNHGVSCSGRETGFRWPWQKAEEKKEEQKKPLPPPLPQPAPINQSGRIMPVQQVLPPQVPVKPILKSTQPVQIINAAKMMPQPMVANTIDATKLSRESQMLYMNQQQNFQAIYKVVTENLRLMQLALLQMQSVVEEEKKFAAEAVARNIYQSKAALEMTQNAAISNANVAMAKLQQLHNQMQQVVFQNKVTGAREVDAILHDLEALSINPNDLDWTRKLPALSTELREAIMEMKGIVDTIRGSSMEDYKAYATKTAIYYTRLLNSHNVILSECEKLAEENGILQSRLNEVENKLRPSGPSDEKQSLDLMEVREAISTLKKGTIAKLKENFSRIRVRSERNPTKVNILFKALQNDLESTNASHEKWTNNLTPTQKTFLGPLAQEVEELIIFLIDVVGGIGNSYFGSLNKLKVTESKEGDETRLYNLVKDIIHQLPEKSKSSGVIKEIADIILRRISEETTKLTRERDEMEQKYNTANKSLKSSDEEKKRLETKIRELESTNAKLNDQLTEATSKSGSLQEEIKILQGEIARHIKNAKSSGDDNGAVVLDLRAKLTKAVSDLEQLTANSKTREKEIERLTAALASKEEDAKKCKDALDECVSKRDKLKSDHESKEKTISDLQQTIKARESRINELTKQIEEAKGHEAKKSELEAKLSKAEEMKESAVRTKTNIEEQVAKLKTEIADLTSAIKIHEDTKKRLQQEKNDIQKERDNLKKDITTRDTEITKLKSELDVSKGSNSKYNIEMKELKDNLLKAEAKFKEIEGKKIELQNALTIAQTELKEAKKSSNLHELSRDQAERELKAAKNFNENQAKTHEAMLKIKEEELKNILKRLQEQEGETTAAKVIISDLESRIKEMEKQGPVFIEQPPVRIERLPVPVPVPVPAPRRAPSPEFKVEPMEDRRKEYEELITSSIEELESIVKYSDLPEFTESEGSTTEFTKYMQNIGLGTMNDQIGRRIIDILKKGIAVYDYRHEAYTLESRHVSEDFKRFFLVVHTINDVLVGIGPQYIFPTEDARRAMMQRAEDLLKDIISNWVVLMVFKDNLSNALFTLAESPLENQHYGFDLRQTASDLIQRHSVFLYYPELDDVIDVLSLQDEVSESHKTFQALVVQYRKSAYLGNQIVGYIRMLTSDYDTNAESYLNQLELRSREAFQAIHPGTRLDQLGLEAKQRFREILNKELRLLQKYNNNARPQGLGSLGDFRPPSPPSVERKEYNNSHPQDLGFLSHQEAGEVEMDVEMDVKEEKEVKKKQVPPSNRVLRSQGKLVGQPGNDRVLRNKK